MVTDNSSMMIVIRKR